MKIRRAGVILAAALLLSGCTQKQQAPSKVIDASGFSTMAVPENGWTAEDIISVSYINGNQMRYPVRMSDLDTDYEAADWELTDYSGFRVRCAYNAGRFIHKNLCYFFYDALSLDDISRDTPADEFTVMYSEGDRDNIFVVNGLPIGGSTGQMLSALGEPVKKTGADGVTVYWFTPDDSSFELTAHTSGDTVEYINMKGLGGKKFQKTGVQ